MRQPFAVLIGIEHEENLSLRYLAGAMEASGFSVELSAWNGPEDEEGIIRSVIELDPPLVGISIPFQHRASPLLELSTALRNHEYRGHIVCGGHFPTFEFEEILIHFPGIDSVAMHEGEETLVELASSLREGAPLDSIPGLVVRTPEGFSKGPARQLPDLDSLPFPDRRTGAAQVFGLPIAPILGSRGCHADCSFCCIQSYFDAAKGPRYRQRSVESIVAEMKTERQRRGIRIFVFHDDTFLLPGPKASLKRYARMWELMKAEKLTDLGLVIKCRPTDVDRDLFLLLAEMGLVRTYIGIESNTTEGLVSLNRRVTAEDNRKALSLFKDLSVFCTYNLLIFDPEATFEGVRTNLEFVEAHADVPFNFCRAEAYPGTPMKARLKAEGRLWGNYLAWDYSMKDPRMSLLARMADTVFQGRNFKGDGVAGLQMALRFEGEILRRFFPGTLDEGFDARLRNFSRRIALDSAAILREAVDFCETADLADSNGIQAFTVVLARSLARSDLQFMAEVRQIKTEILKRSTTPSRKPLPSHNPHLSLMEHST